MLVNKIFGAVLAVLLFILGLQTFGGMLFGTGGHHGGHHEDTEHSINERLAKTFAYYAEVKDDTDNGGGEVVVFDLGKLLAAADAEKGEKSFRSKCSSCHTIDDGGANGTGPNLHDVVGRAMASHAGFGYSAAMQAHVADYPDWSYVALNEFLENPKGSVSGTAMAFAGLRKEPERMNVIAYLASVNPGAPAFPDPLPAADEATKDDPDATTEDLEKTDPEATEVVKDAVDNVVDDAKSLLDQAKDKVEETVKDVVEEKKDDSHGDAH